MPSESESGRVFFARSRRAPDRDSEIRLVSAGVDIGSSTSHLAFSRLVLRRAGGRAHLVRRELLHRSDIMLTPYANPESIDTAALGQFISAQYEKASITPEMIDTGALILTGLAARTANARAIGDLFAVQTGRFVAVAAGDALETRLSAYGSGAVEASRQTGARVMNIDIGGGTSKIAICANGEIEALTAIDIGARLVQLDTDGRVSRIEPAAHDMAMNAGIKLGDASSESALQMVARAMAQCLLEACGGAAMSTQTRKLLRLPALPHSKPPDVISLSGGVSEYLHNREERQFGDLGPALATAVAEAFRGWGPMLREPDAGIRATVLGASQYTVQLSGNTIFVDPASALPLRNLPVIVPAIEWKATLNPIQLAEAITASLQRLDSPATAALSYRWQGEASHARILAFCEGVLRALTGPIILVGERDVGGLIGAHLKTMQPNTAIISIDSVSVRELDFIDIGELLLVSGGVPVVVKSLVFGTGKS